MALAALTSADTFEDHTFNNETFSIIRDATPASSAESTFLMVTNPNTNAVNLNILRLTCAAITSNTSPTGVQTVVRIYINPTITSNGPPQTILQNKVGSVPTSVMRAFLSPVVSSKGTLYDVYAVSSHGESTIDDLLDYTLILQPGNTILITVQGTINGPSEIAVDLEWSEF